MKRISCCTVTLFTVLLSFMVIPGIGSNPVFAGKKPIVLRMVSSAPPGAWPISQSYVEMVKRFNERADGTYKMELHEGGALAKLPEFFDAVRIGAVEMASSPWTMFAFLDPRLGVIEAPFLFNNYEAANYATKAIVPLYDVILQEKFNAKALSLFDFSATELITSKPVRTLDAFKGVLIGTVSPVSAAVTKELGASPVTIMWTDMYEALQKGVADGTMFAYHPALVANYFEVCKNLTLVFCTTMYTGLSINLDVWKKMPQRIQTILIEEVEANHAWLSEEWPKVLEEDLEVFKERGISVYSMPAAERARWIAATEGMREKQLTGFGEFGEKIRQIAQEANRKFPY